MTELAVTTTVSLVNPDLGDLALDDAGLEVVHTSLADEVHQRLNVRLRFFKGEWFLNLLEGTPYYQQILVKAPSDRVIRAVFGTVVTGTEGVASLTSLTYSVNSARQLTLAFEAKLLDGSTYSTQTYGAFVV